jgi:hypothetical protein
MQLVCSPKRRFEIALHGVNFQKTSINDRFKFIKFCGEGEGGGT